MFITAVYDLDNNKNYNCEVLSSFFEYSWTKYKGDETEERRKIWEVFGII